MSSQQAVVDSVTPGAPRPFRVALVGNPNTGKTTLFNRLTGLRARTANYPGITVDLRRGEWVHREGTLDVVDLPGLYSLDAISPEESVARDVLTDEEKRDAVVVVADATCLERSLYLVSEILDLAAPTVVALNLVDAARAANIAVDAERLQQDLNCPVVPVSAKTGEGLDALAAEVQALRQPALPLIDSDHTSCIAGCTGCTFSARLDWAQQICASSVTQPDQPLQEISRIDRLLTHPLAGPAAFLVLMLGVFFLIFSLAGIPMDLVDAGFGSAAEFASGLFPTEPVHPALWYGAFVPLTLLAFAGGYRLAGVAWSRRSAAIAVGVSLLIASLPADDTQSLIVDGIIGGVGGVVIFLPQICILFFMITLLEDSGYMARAAFVMERLMRFVGLPGKAFVPMLSAHACAIPGIMAARTIESWRDRLVTILVLPLLTCSARLPVYSMVTALLFADSPAMGAAVFTGAYVLGIVAALFSAWLLKVTILKGESQPLVLELPPYRLPGLRNALLTVTDRAKVFLQNAGSAILMFSVILWALANYPKLDEADLDAENAAAIAALRAEADTQSGDAAQALQDEAEHLLAREQLSQSLAGRLGHAVEPVFRPLGFDWKINVGVISSFAAREVVVSTLAIVYGLGEDAAEDEESLIATLQRQTHDDGRPVFTTAACMSLLVFYVLAMQCLPTQAVTKRETGSWKWAILQLGYMTVLAWTAALLTYQSVLALGIT